LCPDQPQQGGRWHAQTLRPPQPNSTLINEGLAHVKNVCLYT